jgi:hypothetical protein
MFKQMLIAPVVILALVGISHIAAKAQTSWTDPATGLMWTQQDNGSDLDWKQAVTYCTNLRLGGFANWRLATIDELEAIYEPAPGASGQIKGGIHLASPESAIWSSSEGALNTTVMAYYYSSQYHGKGDVFRNLKLGVRTLCVRHP